MKRFEMDDAPILFATKNEDGSTDLLSFQFTSGSTLDYSLVLMLKAYRDAIANRVLELNECSPEERNELYQAYMIEIARLGIAMSNVLLNKHVKLPNLQFDEFGNLSLGKPTEGQFPATLDTILAFAMREGFPTLD